ncbi:beta-ketoacyl synthase [Dyadobacter flavalbus]|uniref:Beta-ketoacyl synthase n=2 Tax=Dyadobacter flavalbus TaxID=2579942 RepID=A0A5M8R2T1_9BACT|nr:beta-ketoacyl synthase [Dyadobacter flavalbus]
MTYIGAELMISPLGKTTEENRTAMTANRSGISLIADAGFDHQNLFLSKMTDLDGPGKFTRLIIQAVEAIRNEMDDAVLLSERTIFVISSTKGDPEQINDPFNAPVSAVQQKFNLANRPLVISSACISGIVAINTAHHLIHAKLYDHAVVIGCDVLSDFVVYGFQSLFAIGDTPCKPFDAARNGISIGEGCGAVVISASENIFKNAPLQLLAGTTANDANHISGPSRTGEGLFRSVKKTMEKNGIAADELDFISAHGTATVFNDEMESIAFDRLGMSTIPLNSLKGYFGHTLGAAGIIETAASMQMIRNGILFKSLGFQEQGTSKALNIVSGNTVANPETILKTASGFGGGNASLILRSL